MANEFDAVQYPELVIGVAGAIGIDIDEITRSLSEALATVGYQGVPVRITDEIAEEETDVAKGPWPHFGAEMSYKMSHASSVCRKYRSPDTLMRFAMRAIRKHRALVASTSNVISAAEDLPSSDFPVPEERVLPRTAYLIRQLKRPEEVELLRKVYGRQFVLVSAYGTLENRRRVIEAALKRGLPSGTPDHEVTAEANKLIFRDQDEEADAHGQHLRDTFHLADVFVDGNSKSAMMAMITRFIDALFGRADVAPTKWEYGMYAAKSASLRSSDLSRQVGAAVFSRDGELISQGCNEVPKAFGGTYWEGEEPDHRDVKLGYDPNEMIKREVVRDLVEKLNGASMLSEKATAIGNSTAIVEALLKKPADGEEGHGALAEAAVMELTEYGRVVHAEMGAICDAARLGRALKGSILFCTTFPCHNCTKHLLAAGISRVVYMEPYPKSKAKELHEHEIEIEQESDFRVSFLPFLGISPARYRDIFQKGKRKRDGVAVTWTSGKPRPLIEISAPTYVYLESFETTKLVETLQTVGTPTPEANSGN